MLDKKQCKRNGCHKFYLEQENVETSCGYHPGNPIFHDLKKGWACCNQIAWDWEEFEKIPTCAVGKHSNIKQEGLSFSKSTSVAFASNFLQKVKPKALKQNELEEQEEQEAGVKEKKLFKTKNGKLKCINEGCKKEFSEQENGQGVCEYHSEKARFKGTKKEWPCCDKHTEDWDEFVKLPKCCMGYHSPKYI